MKLRLPFGDLPHDDRGSMVIETALILPVLLALSMSTFEVSRMVARENELQTAAAEAAQIALASPPDTTTERTIVKNIIKASTGLADANVTLSNEYRCNTDTTILTTNTCLTTDSVTTYLKIVVTDTYTPFWANYGIGGAYTYTVTRKVIIA